MLGYVIISCLAGMTALAAGLAFGAPLWLSLLAYPVAGATTLLVVPIVRIGRDVGSLLDRRVTAPGAPTEVNALPVSLASLNHADTSTPMRILAVDDDPFILEIVRMIADTSGFSDVVTVGSGKEALKILEGTDRAFDCLLFDINMPELDGSDLCHLVRRMPGYQQTSIIMLTAKRDMKNMERAFRAGATDYATKPFDIVAFGARLQKVKHAGQIHRRHDDLLPENSTKVNAASPVYDANLLRTIRTTAEAEPAGLVSHAALTNYIKELPNSALASARVMAVIVDGIEAFENMPCKRVVNLRQTVADAVAVAFGTEFGLMAYVDDKTLLVATGSITGSSADRQHRLNRSVRQMLGAGSEALEISLWVGEPVQPHIGKESRARAAFDRAIWLAMQRLRIDQSETALQRKPLAG